MLKYTLIFFFNLLQKIPRAKHIDRPKLESTTDPTQANGLNFTTAIAYAPEVPIPSDERNPAFVSCHNRWVGMFLVNTIQSVWKCNHSTSIIKYILKKQAIT